MIRTATEATLTNSIEHCQGTSHYTLATKKIRKLRNNETTKGDLPLHIQAKTNDKQRPNTLARGNCTSTSNTLVQLTSIKVIYSIKYVAITAPSKTTYVRWVKAHPLTIGHTNDLSPGGLHADAVLASIIVVAGHLILAIELYDTATQLAAVVF